MRFDKLTTKFQQALADAQSMAVRSEHPYIEPVHVLSALLADSESGAASLLSRAGVAVNRLQTAIESVLKGLPKVKGGDDNIQASRDLQSVFARTDKEAAKRGDTYIPSELFLLALADDKGDVGHVLKESGYLLED